MLTAGPSFDSAVARTGEEAEGAAQWRMVQGRRYRRRDALVTRSGETGWWCAEMRSVLWATLGAVAATALLLFGAPALF